MLRFLFAAALVFIAAASSDAQPKAEPKGEKIAFLVGIGDFKDPKLQPLNGSPQKDVDEMGKALKAGGYRVVMLKDKGATKAEIEKQFDQQAKGLKEGDLLYVALCTHGFTLKPGNAAASQPYLAAYDSTPGDTATMVPLNDLIDKANGGKEKKAKTLFLIDACREMPDPNRGTGVAEEDVSRVNESVAVCFSCKKGEVSHQSQNKKFGGHGLFSYAVIQVLLGKGMQKEEVSWTGLMHEVEQAFTEKEFAAVIGNKSQTPVYKIDQLRHTIVLQFDNPLAKDANAYMEAAKLGEHEQAGFLKKVTPAQVAVWRAAAKVENSTAQFLLAVCLMNGAGGLAKNEKEAVEFYQQAVKAGHPRAMVNLGLAYSNGVVVKGDKQKALELYTRAERLDEPMAGYNLGALYANGGLGVKENHALALKHFEWAHRRSVRIATVFMALYYLEGFVPGQKKIQPNQVVQRDFKYALGLLTSVQSHPKAMYYIGLMHENGWGVPKKSRQTALDWMREAAAKGDEDAKDFLRQYGTPADKQKYSAPVGKK